jgi:N-carbamoyl-L-amino-acid hydrolase
MRGHRRQDAGLAQRGQRDPLGGVRMARQPGPDEEAVRQGVPCLEDALQSTAVVESFTANTEFDPALAQELAGLLGDVPIIGTGAGHDAGILSSTGTRSAMLFVRNPTGSSHSPAEHADPDDCEAGVAALVTVLRELAGK